MIDPINEKQEETCEPDPDLEHQISAALDALERLLLQLPSASAPQPLDRLMQLRHAISLAFRPTDWDEPPMQA